MRPGLIPLGMVICDTIIQDVKTKKKSLIGIFSQINAQEAPVQHPKLSVYVILTEGNGRYDCELRCIRDDDNSLIMKANGAIEFKDPQQVLELAFDLNGPVFPSFGHYRFEFLVEGDPTISRKFTVTQVNRHLKRGET
ncbi:MAG: hypothetical protein AB1650_05510 [Candidatus Omnitrophota bacterium]